MFLSLFWGFVLFCLFVCFCFVLFFLFFSFFFFFGGEFDYFSFDHRVSHILSSWVAHAGCVFRYIMGT